MRVILQKDVKNVGLTGDIVSVKNGYARHFLFPKKWAVPFTEGSLASARHRRDLIEAKKKKALLLRQTLSDKLKDIKLSFEKPASAEGRLFGSLTVFEISKKLQELGHEVDKKAIKLPAPLKQTGMQKVSLDFGADIKTEIEVEIRPAVLSPSATPAKAVPEEPSTN